jgi:hypothetical protein
MKKALIAVFLVACASAGALDWMLPTFSLRYEISGGTIEDPDPDEDIMIPSSLRNTASFTIREDADPLSLGLLIRYSSKDYLLQAGDYSYLSLDPEAKLKLSDTVTLGASSSFKWATSPELDSSGLSKDYIALKGGFDATWKPVKGTALDISASAEYDLYDAAVKARQLYLVSTGLSSRLGEVVLNVRYRGTFRMPLFDAVLVEPSALNTAAVSLQWDPNR